MFTANAGHRRNVLVVARQVKAGTVIQADDVGETRVAADSSVHVVPAVDRSRVIGQVAAINLAPGTLISLDQLSAGPPLAASQAVVGLALKAAELPSNLQPSDHVMLVESVGTAGAGTSAESGTPAGSAPSSATVLVPNAQVVSVGQASDGQTTLVSVVVPSTTAPAVASASRAEQVSVVLVGGGAP